MAVALKDWLYIASILLGFGVMIFRQGKFFGKMIAHQEGQDKKIVEVHNEVVSIKKVVLPENTQKRLITLEWCDRQQAGCAEKRVIEMDSMREDIVEIKDMARTMNGTLKVVGETLARLDERTGK